MCYEANPDDCPICEGVGYLLDQTHGHADIPDGWLSVQACDECNRYKADDDACCAAASDAGSVAWAYFFGGTSEYNTLDDVAAEAYRLGQSVAWVQLNDRPGDYAIEIYVPLARWAALR